MFLMPGARVVIENEVTNNNFKPVVIIESPFNDGIVGKNFTVRGSARGVNGVREVYVGVGDNFQLAEGKEKWFKNFSLDEIGYFDIKAFCVDVDGNYSSTNVIRVLVNKDFFGILYVATNGDDNNMGCSPDKPFRTISKALEYSMKISGLVSIYVSGGVYSSGFGLPSSGVGIRIIRSDIRVIGGWNLLFTSNIGYTEIDGGKVLEVGVLLDNLTNVHICGFIVKNFRKRGVELINSLYSVITQVIVFSNGNFSINGGGFYLSNSSFNTILGKICSNVSHYGGGICLDDSSYNTIGGEVYSNYAFYSGGGVCLRGGSYNTVGGSIYGNVARWDGGGVCLYNSSSNTIGGKVYSNYAFYYGGGVCLDGGSYNTVVGSIYGNVASWSGGGVYLYNSSSNTIGGKVYDNHASSGGGVYLSGGLSNTLVGSVYGNVASNYGGGVCVSLSYGLSIINSYITNNWTTSSRNSVIHLFRVGDFQGLIISNCYIGGNNDTDSIGIYEDGSYDISGHVLKKNKFITNRLRYLYRDFGGDMIGIDNWANINDPSFTGATDDSTDNEVVRM